MPSDYITQLHITLTRRWRSGDAGLVIERAKVIRADDAREVARLCREAGDSELAALILRHGVSAE